MKQVLKYITESSKESPKEFVVTIDEPQAETVSLTVGNSSIHAEFTYNEMLSLMENIRTAIKTQRTTPRL